MKAVLPLLFVLSAAVVVPAAQERSAPGRLPAPDIVPTQHPALPGDLAQYWHVPPAAALRAAARPDRLEASFARGVKAIAAGEFAAGLPLVASPALRATPLAGYAAYFHAAALRGLARLPEADAVLTAVVDGRPAGYLREAATLALADLAMERGDAVRAEKLLREAVDRNPGEPADVLLRLAQVEEAAGHPGHALEAYRTVYYAHPLHAGAVDAKMALDRLRPAASGAAPSIEEELARASRLFAARQWREAREAFDPLMTSTSGDERALVTLRVAAIDYRLGRHRVAREQLQPLLSRSPLEAEAAYYYASATRGLGDGAGYVRLARALADRHRDSPWAAEVLNDLASYHVVRNEQAAADSVFRLLLARFPEHRHAERAAWKVGWDAYRRGDLADTVQVFESAARAFPRADYRPSWLYWSARARQRMADGAGAAALLRVVIADYGSSYYGRLASRALGPRAAAPSPARTQAAGAPRGMPDEPTVVALMLAGLHDEALREVQFVQRTSGDSPRLQATAAWIRSQQAAALRGDQRFAALRGSITGMRRAYPQFMTAQGHTLPAEILGVIFPLDYWDLIQKYSKAHDLDPYLIAALMAQESTFTAEIRSPANARGLMQVMPATGRDYARRLGIRPFSTASLSQAEINVRIGLRYFKDLMNRFGEAHYALAGYNAGESRVVAWRAAGPGLAADEFIDSIPFAETQNYVKRILGTAEDYRRLYSTGLLVPNPALGIAAGD